MSLNRASTYPKVRTCFNYAVIKNFRYPPEIRAHTRLLECFEDRESLATLLLPNIELVNSGDLYTLHFEIKDSNGIPVLRKIIYLERPDTYVEDMVREYYSILISARSDALYSGNGDIITPILPAVYDHLILGMDTNTDMPLIYTQEMSYRAKTILCAGENGEETQVVYVIDPTSCSQPGLISLQNFDYLMREYTGDNLS